MREEGQSGKGMGWGGPNIILPKQIIAALVPVTLLHRWTWPGPARCPQMGHLFGGAGEEAVPTHYSHWP